MVKIQISSTNVDQIIGEYMHKNQLTHQQAFLQMYHSTNPILSYAISQFKNYVYNKGKTG